VELRGGDPVSVRRLISVAGSSPAIEDGVLAVGVAGSLEVALDGDGELGEVGVTDYVLGRSHDWTSDQTEAYRILNASHHSLSILTYDHVLARARRMISVASAAVTPAIRGDVPF